MYLIMALSVRREQRLAEGHQSQALDGEPWLRNGEVMLGSARGVSWRTSHGLMRLVMRGEQLMRLRILTPLLLTALLLVPGPAAQADTTDDFILLEQQLTDALGRSDARAIDGLWSDDLVWIGLNGKPSSKAQRLAGMTASVDTSAPAVVTVNNKRVESRVYGKTAVVTVLSTWTTRTSNGESASDYMATHVWNKQHGSWRLVSAHISRMAAQ